MTNTDIPDATKILDNSKDSELSQMKVLFVEDDQMIRDLVTTKLMASGCIAYSTANGSEAIRMTMEHTPDIIILDLMLPGMTGEEILKNLKSTQALEHIPVVIFSNKSEGTDKENMMGLGAAGYYVKAATDLNTFIADLKVLAKK